MSIVFNNGEELTERQRILFCLFVKFLKIRIESGDDDTIITLSPDEFKALSGIEYSSDAIITIYKTLHFPIHHSDFDLEHFYVYWPISGVNIGVNEVSFEVSQVLIENVKSKDWQKLFLNHAIKAGITSKCGLALFDLIVNDADFLPWTVSLEDFKLAMGIDPKKYPRPNELKYWCIDVGIEEINEKTPYKLAYQQTKDGRIVTGLTFFLKDEDF